jgi:membrane protein DedA with SNARE-associated domain
VATVLVGRLTPLVRSLISIPVGVLGSNLVTFTLLGSLTCSSAINAIGAIDGKPRSPAPRPSQW